MSQRDNFMGEDIQSVAVSRSTKNVTSSTMKKTLMSYLCSPGAICVIFFWIGYLTAPDDQSSNNTTTTTLLELPDMFPIPEDAKPQNAALLLLQQQEHAHETLQSRIWLLQHPNDCDQARKLMVHPRLTSSKVVGANAFEQFAREFHLLSVALQVAVSTGRALVLADDWELLPDTSEKSGCAQQDVNVRISPSRTIKNEFKRISCLQQSTLLHCGGSGKMSTSSSQQQQQDTHLDPSSSFGILPEDQRETEHSLFDVRFYGPDMTVDMPQWPFPRSTMLIDTLPMWERSRGRFWVRSQMVHYIWERWQNNATGHPDSFYGHQKILSEDERSIAFYWSSSKSLRKNLAVKFGRNASVTQDFERYMQVAETIREHYFSQVKTIYLITDGTNEVPLPRNLEKKWRGWEFVLPFVAGTDKTIDDEEEMRVIASLEMMRQADFLVGSFQSQIFRLACELNAAWFAGKYAATTRRHWPLDVEWFENP